MDACDQLLLSEGVCRQLGMIRFHPSVERWKKVTGTSKSHSRESTCSDTPNIDNSTLQPQEAKVPTVRVHLVQTAHLLPRQSKVVEVRLSGDITTEEEPFMLESTVLDCGAS